MPPLHSSQAATGAGDTVLLDLSRVDAAVFDLDGVIATTAKTHETAWREALTRHAGGRPLSHEEYREHIDGKARLDGARAILDTRGVETDEETVSAFAADKNEAFLRALDETPPEALPGARDVLDALSRAGVALGLFTASRNARRVLRALGEEERFATIVDGERAAADGLASKPAPDLPLACAADLGAAPGTCALFEDAIAGVKAGEAGGFRFVIGIGEGAHADALREAGATAVASSLASVTLGAGVTSRGKRR